MTKTLYNIRNLHLHNFTEVSLGNKMENIPNMSGVLRGNCCKTCLNIPQKTLMKEFRKHITTLRCIIQKCIGFHKTHTDDSIIFTFVVFKV